MESHVNDLIPAYALDCLDEDELGTVAEHLAVCGACQAELRTYQEIVAQLPLAAPSVEPPADMKAHLMARLDAPVKSGFTVPKASRIPPWRSFLASPVWAAVSLALVVVLIASNLLLWNQFTRLNAGLARTDVLRVVNLTGTEAASTATGLIVVSMDGMHGTLVVDRLPKLDDDRQYQLWLIDNGERSSGGVFSVSKDGYGSLWVDSPQPLASYAAFGITVEPAGGSPGPTGEKVLGGEF